MAVERYGSKTDVVVKLVLVFFIALLSFSIGTFVGKKFSDNQHKLAQLEPGHEAPAAAAHGEDHGEARAVASIPSEHGEVKPDRALSDEEIAKLAEEFITDDKEQTPGKVNDKAGSEATHAKADDGHGAAHVEKAAAHEAPKAAAPQAAAAAPAATATPAAHGTTHGTPAATAKAQQPLKPASRMAEGGAPVVENPARPTSRIPSSLPKEVASSAIGKYTVQVASYADEKEAQTMAADLKSKGFSAFYVSAKVKGQTWYRVSVGLFTTPKEADAYKSDLIARAKTNSAIVQKITSAE